MAYGRARSIVSARKFKFQRVGSRPEQIKKKKNKKTAVLLDTHLKRAWQIISFVPNAQVSSEESDESACLLALVKAILTEKETD